MRGHCEGAAVSRGAPAQWGGARGQVCPGRAMEKRNAKPNQTEPEKPKQTKSLNQTKPTRQTKPNQTKPRQTSDAEKVHFQLKSRMPNQTDLKQLNPKKINQNKLNQQNKPNQPDQTKPNQTKPRQTSDAEKVHFQLKSRLLGTKSPLYS